MISFFILFDDRMSTPTPSPEPENDSGAKDGSETNDVETLKDKALGAAFCSAIRALGNRLFSRRSSFDRTVTETCNRQTLVGVPRNAKYFHLQERSTVSHESCNQSRKVVRRFGRQDRVEIHVFREVPCHPRQTQLQPRPQNHDQPDTNQR